MSRDVRELLHRSLAETQIVRDHTSGRVVDAFLSALSDAGLVVVDRNIERLFWIANAFLPEGWYEDLSVLERYELIGPKPLEDSTDE